jgi:hypothetical protein
LGGAVENLMPAANNASDESRPVDSPTLPNAAPANSREAAAAKQFVDASGPAEQLYDEFVLQDINDPWILDEIDTLPEEYEMEEVNWPDAPATFSPSLLEEGRGAPQALPPRPSPPSSSSPVPQAEEVLLDEPASAHANQRRSQIHRNGPQPIRQTQTVRRIQFEGDRRSLLRQIVGEHPHYGPATIQKYLEARLEPAIIVSRSTVYRWLRLEGLNTREQRLQFAGKAAAA